MKQLIIQFGHHIAIGILVYRTYRQSDELLEKQKVCSLLFPGHSKTAYMPNVRIWYRQTRFQLKIENP